MKDVLGLGNLLFALALLFATLIVVFEFLERRREGRRERRMLDQIEREYRAYFHLGRL